MEAEMARIAVAVADHIVSPLGFTTSDNFAAVKAGNTGLQRYSGKWGLPEPFMAALIDRDEALAAYRRSLELEPGNGKVSEKLRKLEEEHR